MKTLLKLSVFASMLILITIISCQKTFSPSFFKDDQLVKNAKDWFKNYKEISQFDSALQNIEYQWEKAKVFTYSSGYKMVAIPLKEVNQSSKYDGVRLLYLHPWKNGTGFYTSVLEFIPDLNNLKSKKITLKNFTGYLNSWSLKKGFQRGLYIKNAVVEKSIELQIGQKNIINTTATATTAPAYYITAPAPSASQIYIINLIVNGIQMASINYLMYGQNNGASNPCEVTGPGSCNETPLELMDEEYLHSLFYDSNDFLYQRKQELNEKLANNPFALEPCDSLNIMPLDPESGYGTMYQRVAQFTPSQYVKDRIDSIRNISQWEPDFYDLTNVNYAHGSVVNCDFFPIRITQLPIGFTAQSLTEYFRKNINKFIDSSIGTTFTPYNDNVVNGFNDTIRFNANDVNSIGTILSINMLNDGSVIQSNYYHNTSGGYDSHRFTFTTMVTPIDNDHPVAGNREFGLYKSTDPLHPNDYVFYTMGVDRVSDWMFDLGNGLLGGFAMADELWNNVQKNMINFINDPINGGHAQYYTPSSIKARPKWSEVEDYLMGNQDWEALKQKLGC